MTGWRAAIRQMIDMAVRTAALQVIQISLAKKRALSETVLMRWASLLRVHRTKTAFRSTQCGR
jgi:hypothetical protein